MHPRVGGQLGMEGGPEEVALARRGPAPRWRPSRPSTVTPGPDPGDPRRPDEHAFDRVAEHGAAMTSPTKLSTCRP